MKNLIQIALSCLIIILFSFSTLSATVSGTYYDDFEGAYDTELWTNVSNGSISANCGSVAGDALYFRGNGTRSATTVPFVNNEVTVSFYLKIGTGSAPCENADQVDGENIVLEYSNDGSTWTILNTYLADDPNFASFYHITENIPASGKAVQVRIRQLTHSGDPYDHWSIDNFRMSSTIPTLSEWAAIILGGLFAIAGGWFIWRRV